MLLGVKNKNKKDKNIHSTKRIKYNYWYITLFSDTQQIQLLTEGGIICLQVIIFQMSL